MSEVVDRSHVVALIDGEGVARKWDRDGGIQGEHALDLSERHDCRTGWMGGVWQV